MRTGGSKDWTGRALCGALVVLLLVVGAAAAGDVAAADLAPPSSYPGLSADLAALFADGLRQFATDETPATGLGPLFNATSCAACHANPTIGGSSARNVTRFGRLGPDGFDPMPEEGGPVLQDHAIATDECSVPQEVVPVEASIVAQRNTPPLYGLGIVDTIPDRAILRLARSAREHGGGLNGRPNLVHGRVGRFGWKAQVASLRQFTASAYLNEIGITSADFRSETLPDSGCDPAPDPEDDGTRIDAVTRFLVLLAPLPSPVPALRAGRVTFRTIGCESCHATSLRAGRRHPVASVRGRRVPMFSDLLLHDMGPGLGDGVPQGFATGNDFKTPPLWGLGSSGPYLHDGRAATVEEAIALHDGEAFAARNRFLELPADRRAALLAFLESL